MTQLLTDLVASNFAVSAVKHYLEVTVIMVGALES
jgi:hypothetical protein